MRQALVVGLMTVVVALSALAGSASAAVDEPASCKGILTSAGAGEAGEVADNTRLMPFKSSRTSVSRLACMSVWRPVIFTKKTFWLAWRRWASSQGELRRGGRAGRPLARSRGPSPRTPLRALFEPPRAVRLAGHDLPPATVRAEGDRPAVAMGDGPQPETGGAADDRRLLEKAEAPAAAATAAVGASVVPGWNLWSNGGPTHRLDAGLAHPSIVSWNTPPTRGRTWPPPRGDETDGNRDPRFLSGPSYALRFSSWPTWISASSLSSPSVAASKSSTRMQRGRQNRCVLRMRPGVAGMSLEADHPRLRPGVLSSARPLQARAPGSRGFRARPPPLMLAWNSSRVCDPCRLSEFVIRVTVAWL